ncbi:hypothetical protein [Paenibacillus kribbensis]|uniref:hypothetical protein n=1 Tax=Paenibacillus kribbensis TaxID=172713 RepID=UPI0008384EE6|nr:hypothetical protein [Paenibacillus kribbensis]
MSLSNMTEGPFIFDGRGGGRGPSAEEFKQFFSQASKKQIAEEIISDSVPLKQQSKNILEQEVNIGTKGTGKDKTFVDQMDTEEAARYKRYWEQDYKDISKGQMNTRQRQYTAPGTRSITDQKINGKTGELYDRETIYDQYGRRIGNNDYTDHGRPDVPTHTNPHHHANPWYNPNQHGPGTPGLHPETPRW